MRTLLRRIVPIVVFVFVLVRVVAIVSDYREGVAGTDPQASQETTPSVEPTQTPGGEGSPPAADGGGEGASEPADQPEEEPTQQVIVTIPGLNFRTEPSSDSEVMRTLTEGTRLTLLGEQDGWYQVRDADGVTGWISSSSDYVRVEDQ